ncbi:recombinase family protein [Amycolatopsis solani]|uniref:recombinase family protein n=1 Tax=Amycolatopsis solani TaxID=3028615 RepID=UPI0025AF4E03|nr:recombinase family protein [Amycolatopsis sp. MEP2-6]
MASGASGLVAVRYNRVSDDKRKLSRSVAEQNSEGLAVTVENGWIDGGSFADPDMSASRFAKKKRPEWVKLADEVLPSGKVHVLVLWEPARASRVLSTWALLLERCRDLGVLIHITSHEQTYDLSKPRHWKTLADDGVKAVYDSEETSLRIRRDVRGHAETGRPYGPVLYGYARIYDQTTKDFVEQVIVEEKAAAVREIADWIAAKKSINSLIEHLHKRGIPSPGGRDKWSMTTIRKTVLNPAYIGKRVLQGEVFGPGVWPAILTEKQHLDCVAVLKAEGRAQERDGAVKHLLSGLMVCDRCEAVLRVLPAHGHNYYACKKRCVGVRQSEIEPFVCDVVFARAGRDDFAELLATKDDADEAAKHELEAQRLRAALEGYYQQAEPTVPEDERLTPGGLARMERHYLPLIEEAERKAKESRVPAVLRAVVGPGLRGRWPGLDIAQQREVIRTLMTIRVLPIGRGKRAAPEDRTLIDWL